MIKQKYKISFLAIFLLILSLGLSSCINVDNEKQLKELQSQNKALQDEIDALKKGLATETAATEKPTESKATSSQSSELSVSPPTETSGEFVYRGNMEIDGKRVADMSREEIEALPTVGTPVLDPKTGTTTMIYPPEGIKNLYEQLEYVDRMNKLTGWVDNANAADSSKSSEPVQAGSYDVTDKSLAVYRSESDQTDLVYEIQASDKEALLQWLKDNLTDQVNDASGAFSYDTELFVADGSYLLFTQDDFLEAQNKQYTELMYGQGEIFQLDLKSEAALQFRDLISSNRQNVIYDEATALAERPGELPSHSLWLGLEQRPDTKELNFCVRNSNDETWAFRNAYSIFYYDGENWQQMQPTMAGDCYQAREVLIMPQEDRAININYASCYGDLPQGYYRMDIKMETQKDGQDHPTMKVNSDKETYAIYFAIQ